MHWRIGRMLALTCGLAALAVILSSPVLKAQQNLLDGIAANNAPSRAPLGSTTSRPLDVTGEATAEVSPNHPLFSVIKFARQEHAYLREHVRDFTCRLVKRERIDGFLQDYQFIDMRVREEQREGDRVVKPFAIYLHFAGPAKVAGRRVLFVEGQNEGKMLVRNGGRHFDYVLVRIDPQGESAQEESLVPITHSGFNRVLSTMIEILERHARLDPTGKNTTVERIAGAKLNERPTSVIRIVHPTQQKGFEFHIANVFVDDELRVPVRVDFSDWPQYAKQKPPLVAEYTYTDLKLNVGLADSNFTPARLKSDR